jgi:toxin ParE1/3/4
VADVEEAVAWYVEERSKAAALAFIASLVRAYQHLGRHPGSGSLRYADELGLPGLRCCPMPRHPYLIFYVARANHVDVWRVLHGCRDIPAWMTGMGGA